MAIDKIKRVHGRTTYRVRVLMTDGRRVSKCFSRKADAEAYETKLAFQKNQGVSIIPQRTKFSELCSMFIRDHVSTLQFATRQKYQHVVDRKLTPVFGSMYLDQISEHCIEVYRADLFRTEKSPASRHFIFCSLKTILNKGVTWKRIPTNPSAGVKPPPMGIGRIEYWRESEVSKFLEAMKDHPRLPLYILALNTGMREGEIFGLKWDCVDFESAHITVRRAFCQKEHRIKNDTKTHRSRIIGMSPVIRKHLLRVKMAQRPKEEDPVLTPLSMGISRLYHCARTFRGDCRRVGVREIRFHDLRHTYATLYLSSGGSISDLADILGHTSVEMTERYGHFRKERAVKIASVLSFDVPTPADIIPIGGHKMVTEEPETKNPTAIFAG